MMKFAVTMGGLLASAGGAAAVPVFDVSDTRAAAAAAAAFNDDQCSVPEDSRQDCGVVGTDQSECEAKGCCWMPDESRHDVPWCFYKSGQAPSCPLKYSFDPSKPPFSPEQTATMRGLFLDNINIDGSGAVVASPDHDTPGGSYYYHWERDGALTMSALLSTADNVTQVQPQFEAYVGWVKKVQNQPDPNDQSVLAEPKYTIPDGKPYTGPWCRPQNDGPGLRAKALCEYASAIINENGDEGELKDVASLWPLISKDLDWVASNWQADGCDLWEEIRSSDFFWNRFTMRASLSKGAAIAQKIGDKTRASTYTAAAASIKDTLNSHFDSSASYIFETDSRKKDAAVVCALNDGDIGDGVFAPQSKEVAGTIATLNNLFCTSFAINQADTKAGVPGILYGRYQGDGYAGGNPWILLTSALAELLYRGASEFQSMGVDAAIDTATRTAWAQALSLDDSDAASMSAADLASALAGAADGVLLRLGHHVAAGGFHLPEQIDRNSGVPMAAKDLTWSYATTLKALHARTRFVQALQL